MILAEDDVELIDSETRRYRPRSGSIGITRDTSQVIIEPVAPEEFLIEQQAKSMMDAKFCAHQTRKTLSELRDMGFTDEQLDKIGDHEHVDLDTSPEVLARHDDLNITKGLDAQGYQDQVRDVMVIEAYMMVDIEGTGTATLHRILKAGNALLEVEEVEPQAIHRLLSAADTPQFLWQQLCRQTVRHAERQDSPDKVNPRSRDDHQQPALHGHQRWPDKPARAYRQSCRRPGQCDRPDAIAPMPQALLNPFVFQTLAGAAGHAGRKHRRQLVLTTGMNKDACLEAKQRRPGRAAHHDEPATPEDYRQELRKPVCEATIPRGLSPGRRERAARKNHRHLRHVSFLSIRAPGKRSAMSWSS